MLFLFKALLGVATIGGGVVLPVAMSQSGTDTGTKTLQEHARESGKALGETVNRLVGSLVELRRKEQAKSQENGNFSAVFKDLQDKGCQLIQNPAGSKDDFHALYACKKNKKDKSQKTSFYYLGSRDSVKVMGRDALKEITTATYKSDGQLMFALKDSNQQISISVVADNEGGWSYFNNVNLSDKCQIETRMLGGEDLRCELVDKNNSRSFFYNFSIF
ncbi:hypothetical protein WEN_00210 [Mycoplasma wenyonii str. Massachusetts]|uniref:Uncharacterized protein n=1 Tax=Mycoplasma wenyonii (strain Massachusetts) TaxID=1197325 RepID=I6YKV7_MYCWM|nr:hypothetical protein [Mycoplasma wenyonii]AFN64849.1 hypothetical protein WEN_00210 [Mycoplasma wenyonii str. Massachusetts]